MGDARADFLNQVSNNRTTGQTPEETLELAAIRMIYNRGSLRTVPVAQRAQTLEALQAEYDCPAHIVTAAIPWVHEETVDHILDRFDKSRIFHTFRKVFPHEDPNKQQCLVFRWRGVLYCTHTLASASDFSSDIKAGWFCFRMPKQSVVFVLERFQHFLARYYPDVEDG
jgi:hypothetical protein